MTQGDLLPYPMAIRPCHVIYGQPLKDPVPSNARQAVAGGTISALKTTTALIPMEWVDTSLKGLEYSQEVINSLIDDRHS